MSQVAELVTILNHSSSESEDESARSSTNSKSKCKRGTNKQYNIIGTYDSKEQVEKEIKENHRDYSLKIMMADAAPAITNGFL